MAKHNPQRSLEIVVDAPLQECIHALGHLENPGGKFALEFVDLQVNQLSSDYAHFLLVLKRKNNWSLIKTALKGELQRNPNGESTTVVGKIAPIYGRLLFDVVVMSLIAFFVITSSLSVFVKALIVLTLGLAVAPFYLFHVYQQDRDDVERILKITVRELNSAAYRYRQQAIDASQNESPFY